MGGLCLAPSLPGLEASPFPWYMPGTPEFYNSCGSSCVLLCRAKEMLARKLFLLLHHDGGELVCSSPWTIIQEGYGSNDCRFWNQTDIVSIPAPSLTCCVDFGQASHSVWASNASSVKWGQFQPWKIALTTKWDKIEKAHSTVPVMG